MEHRNILVEESEGIMKITINRPEALNSLSVEMLQGIEEAFAEFYHGGERGSV